MDYSEKLVIKGLREGDTEAFKYIYDTHYQVLCHFASRYLRDTYLAESVVGDVIFHLWENHARLEVDVSLRSYLMRCVRNSCLDYLRSQHEKFEIATPSMPSTTDQTMVTSNSDHPLGQLLDKELAEKLDEAVALLPTECRTVFEMSRFAGKKHAEIALELGISVNTVKYHIKRALSLLNEQLGRYIVMLVMVVDSLIHLSNK